MDPEQIIRIEGADLTRLKTALVGANARILRIYVEGDAVKFKVNEHTWSAPMGMSEATHNDLEMEKYDR